MVGFDNAEDDELPIDYCPNDQDGAVIVTTRKPNLGFELTDIELRITPFSDQEETEALLQMTQRKSSWRSSC